jgi:hypothetical protein
MVLPLVVVTSLHCACSCTVDSTAPAPEVERLQQLADGKGPLPEADFAEQLKGLGLPWRARKTSRLKRGCIARPPEVWRLTCICWHRLAGLHRVNRDDANSQSTRDAWRINI